MQEAARLGFDQDVLALAPDIEPVERLDRVLSAWQWTERKVVKSCRPTSACAAWCIASASSGRGDVPRLAPLRARAARGDWGCGRDSAARCRRSGRASRPAIDLALDHRDRLGAQLGVERFRPAGTGVSFFSISTCARIASAWTPASVRPAACSVTRLAGHRQHGFLDRLLHGRPVRLPLQAHERAAVEFEGEGEAGQRTMVPAGTGLPRSNSARVHRRLARALDAQRADRAVAAGDGQLVVEHRAGSPSRPIAWAERMR